VHILLATDVDNPLLGPSGAAAVYAPQKGASAAQVAVLDDALSRWAQVVQQVRPAARADAAGAGAAGGVGFAAMAVLGAEPHPGIELVLDLVGFDAHLERADLVITGEGSLDAQTLRGKGPAGVADAAARGRVPVVAVAGRVRLDRSELRAAGFAAAYALLDLEPDPDVCIAEAGSLLERLGRTVAGSLPGFIPS
jgi:glycerate kinase